MPMVLLFLLRNLWNLRIQFLGYAVGGLRASQKIFARLLINKAGVLELEIGALNFALIDGKLLG